MAQGRSILAAVIFFSSHDSGADRKGDCAAILKKLGVPWVLVVAQDMFYKSLTPEQSKKAFENEWGTWCGRGLLLVWGTDSRLRGTQISIPLTRSTMIFFGSVLKISRRQERSRLVFPVLLSCSPESPRRNLRSLGVVALSAPRRVF